MDQKAFHGRVSRPWLSCLCCLEIQKSKGRLGLVDSTRCLLYFAAAVRCIDWTLLRDVMASFARMPSRKKTSAGRLIGLEIDPTDPSNIAAVAVDTGY